PSLRSFCPLSFLHSCSHQLLHSFPTRRSSDLLAGVDVPDPGDGARVEEEVLDRLLEPARLPEERRAAHLAVERLGAEPLDGEVRDRKSTRLNSSHGSISYAVFCLKKKKQTGTP